jgi:hypothetical protein
LGKNPKKPKKAAFVFLNKGLRRQLTLSMEEKSRAYKKGPPAGDPSPFSHLLPQSWEAGLGLQAPSPLQSQNVIRSSS